MDTHLIYQLRFLSDLTEGPQGKPLFVYTDIESKKDEAPNYRSRLATWDEGLHLLTQSEAKKPFWQGNYIYFMRKVDKVSQLFRLPISGGEAEQLTFFKAGITHYKANPDGSSIALLSQGDYQSKPDQAKIFDTWPVKYDQKGLLGPTAGLWLWLNGSSQLLYQPQQEIEEITWNTGGTGLYLVMAGTAQEKWSWKQRVYSLGLDGNLNELFGGVGPISTPDGGLAYLAHAWDYGGGTESKLYHHNKGNTRLLTEGSFLNSINSDMRIGSAVQTPTLGPDGALYVVTTKDASARVLRVSLEGHSEFMTPAEQSVLGYAICGSELYTLSETLTQGATLKKADKVLFDPNADVLPNLPIPAPIIHQTESHGVPGWVLLPEGQGRIQLFCIFMAVHTRLLVMRLCFNFSFLGPTDMLWPTVIPGARLAMDKIM